MVEAGVHEAHKWSILPHEREEEEEEEEGKRCGG